MLFVSLIYLHCRYCSPEHDFPKQADAVGFVVHKAQEALRHNPSTLIVSGTYTIGKEKVFLGMCVVCVVCVVCVFGVCGMCVYEYVYV